MPNTIQPGEPAAGPLTRAGDAVARVITAATETLYDYSGGRYGLHPVDAADVRRERAKERDREGEQARSVTIIESSPQTETAPARGRRRALPLVVVGAMAAAAIVGLVVWRRRRMRRLATRVAPAVAWEPSGPPAPTPSFERVIRGELIPHPPVAPAGTSVGSRAPGTNSTGAGIVHDGHSRDSVAGEFSETNTPPRE